MALYFLIYPGRMEGPPTSALNHTPYWYNPVGSSTAVFSTATWTGGATYGISVNNSYTAVNTTSVPSQYPSASRTAREGQTEDESDCTVGTSDVEYDCTVVSHGPHTQKLIFCFWSDRKLIIRQPGLFFYLSDPIEKKIRTSASAAPTHSGGRWDAVICIIRNNVYVPTLPNCCDSKCL